MGTQTETENITLLPRRDNEYKNQEKWKDMIAVCVMVFVQSFVEIGPAVKEEIRSIETYIHWIASNEMLGLSGTISPLKSTKWTALNLTCFLSLPLYNLLIQPFLASFSSL